MNKTTKTIYGKFAAATAEMIFDKTGKDYSGMTNSNYSLDDILPVVKSVLNKHGLTHFYSQIENEKSITSRITIVDVDSGDKHEVDMFIPKTAYLNVPKNKLDKPLMTDPQWCGAINSYFKRYTYVNAFGVSEGDLLLDTSSYNDNGKFVNYGNQQFEQPQPQNNYQPQTNFAVQQQPVFNVPQQEQVQQVEQAPSFIQNFTAADPLPFEKTNFETPQTDIFSGDIQIELPTVQVGVVGDLKTQIEKVIDSYQNLGNEFNIQPSSIKTRINALRNAVDTNNLTQLKVENATKKHNEAIAKGEKL